MDLVRARGSLFEIEVCLGQAEDLLEALGRGLQRAEAELGSGAVPAGRYSVDLFFAEDYAFAVNSLGQGTKIIVDVPV